jgi:anti-sigma B factor antagonist
MAATLTIHGSCTAGVATVTLAGELDLAGKADLRAQVDTLLHDPAVTSVVLDLSRLTFVDSTGIGALVGCLRLADETGKGLRAAGAQGRVASLLDLTGVATLLTGR